MTVSVAVLACVDARIASAQGTRTGVFPSVTAGVVFDDNVFAQPIPESDVLFRVSPAVTAMQVRPRRTITAAFGFDAERYERFADLSTPTARTVGSIIIDVKPSPKQTWGMSAGYLGTNNPMELNTLTSISTARRHADRFEYASRFQHDPSRITTFEIMYSGNRDGFVDNVTYTNGVDLRFGRKLNPHSELFVRANSRIFNFGSLGGRTLTNQLTSGWVWRGRSSTVNLAGGVSETLGQVAGTGAIAVTRTFGALGLNGRFEKGTTSSVGIPGVVEFDRVELGVSRQSRLRMANGQPRGLRFTVAVGAARNIMVIGETRNYLATVEIFRPMTKTLTFVVAYNGTWQETVHGTSGLLGGDILRNRVAANIQFSPWSSR